MPYIRYQKKRFTDTSMKLIDAANEIIITYSAEGYKLSLRQLYYKLVTMNVIENSQPSYKRLGSLISNARRAGLVDWNAIEDRGRVLRSVGTWESPKSIVSAVSEQYKEDVWADQPHYVEVWFEKDALMGVMGRIANQLRVPFLSCRGYTSDSEMWAASQRLARHSNADRPAIVLHFGDHDASGLDMTRDIEDRLSLFQLNVTVKPIAVRRLALNFDQIEKYEPPPNPAKEKDPRFAEYTIQYGSESWELDALEPKVLAAFARDEVRKLLDMEKWDAAMRVEQHNRRVLRAISENFERTKYRLRKQIAVLPDVAHEEVFDAED